MLCADPFMMGVIPGKCGQCDSCLSSRRRIWRDRLILESFKHDSSSFVTLTYDEKNVPSDGSVQVSDYQLWLKRLRKSVYPRKFRYYIAAEYGGRTWRPHYHAALFGLNPLSDSSFVQSTWNKGFVQIGSLTPQSMAYVAGYVTKKLLKSDVRRADLKPEFSRMSLRPGIGAFAMEDVARVVSSDFGLDFVLDNCDVPSFLKYKNSSLTFGSYLRGKLRLALGHSKDTPPQLLQKYAEKMRDMLQTDEAITSRSSGKNTKQILVDINSQKRLNLLKRREIFNDKGHL